MVWVGRPGGKKQLNTRRRWNDDIRNNGSSRSEVARHVLDGFGSKYRQVAGACECGNEPSGSIEFVEFLDQITTFSGKVCSTGVYLNGRS
jgi:hypothetical protein